MADVAVLVHYVPTGDTDTESTTAGTVAYLFGNGTDPIDLWQATASQFIRLLVASCLPQ